ncbi:type II toxin-antitoxin system VapC family toxin [Curtobacterium caseinilyticum]|uniref:Ribonuclease VapC n=1 Tax=Curtobacterium caseinilyticum TaxID=3055137 RepID=A0ABT7TRA6_9MICO|nr:PIN domain-containing protein [Curtobacterium caseinilyticum]MDM7891422.1 PIN domain-containing protein [Curtobacterium caseinilyticum]
MLDANVVIALLDEDDDSHARAYDLVEDHAWDDFCTSALTLGEMLVRPAARGPAERERSTIERLGVSVVPVTSSTAVAAARVRADRRVAMPDAVVLVTARSVGAELATFDRKLRRIARSEGLVVAELQDDGEPWPFPT